MMLLGTQDRDFFPQDLTEKSKFENHKIMSNYCFP